ncbi:MAG: ketopantoate reductase family protein [Gammaproteobacteria bacterium]|nr:ketopantoate reductase family protein [Gammaproteobacteria bacterium]
MRFTIVGAGALGSILGAHLIKAGHQVQMIARGARAEQLREQGLRVRGLTDLDLACDVAQADDAAPACDALVYTVKTYHMTDALKATRHIDAQSVFSVANGVLKNELLAKDFGRDRVLGCMADTSGELKADGQVEFTRNVCLYVGSLVADAASRSAAVAQAIDTAGVNARSVGDIASVEWSKFVGWIALFTLCVLGRANTGRILSNPELAALAVHQVKEMGAIAAAVKVQLIDQSPLPVASIIEQPFEAAVETVRAVGDTFTRTAPSHRMSSLQDLEAGRRLEVEGTLGHAVRIAHQQHIEVPTLELCLSLVTGIDALQPSAG